MSRESLPEQDAVAYPALQTIRLVEKAIANLKDELSTRFIAIETRFDGMDKATGLLHDDYVRVPTLLDRAIDHLRTLIFAEIDKTKAISTERLARIDTIFAAHQTAIDAALMAQQASSSDRSALLMSEVEKLRAVTVVQFESINNQFVERDKRTEQLSLADKTAIAAALQAQKEAAGATNDSNSAANTKMETNFSKLIEQTQNLLQSVSRNTDEKINDLKSRIDRGEGKTSVSDPAVSDGIKQLGMMIADLGKSRDTASGHAGGVSQVTGLIIGLGGLVVAATVLFIKSGGLH